MKTYIAYFGLLFISTSLWLAPTDEYEVADGYSIDFKSKDPSGSFKEMDGKISYDANSPENAKFDLTIDVASINTGNGMQNKKAQTEEWFDGKKYPKIKFKSTKVEKKGSDLVITGDLTVKGTTKTYSIPASVSQNGNKVTFKGTFSVSRSDFKVGKKSDVVPDAMKVSYVVPASKK
ncbi:MAG: hypothetical protein RL264_2720 [Bacteroidota bacterium]|jgi:polyisoprenoid-binding protein YceI